MTRQQWALGVALLLTGVTAFGHAISEGNAAFVEGVSGVAVGVFGYLGAKHMFTGIDHVLYLVGVVFYLRRLRDVLVYVTLFTAGHSLTLLVGVLAGWRMDAHLVDAVIGLSVVYKAFENVGGFARGPKMALAGVSGESVGGGEPSAGAASPTADAQGSASISPVAGGVLPWKRSFAPDPRLAVFAFGLCHGMGLATRVQELQLSSDGLLVNLVSFNLGVEVGQLLALAAVVGALAWWRRLAMFERSALALNLALMTAGFVLFQTQIVGYFMAGAGG